MALLIKGTMPPNCGFCIELRREGNGVCWCNRMQKQISEVVPPYDKRMEWCPIIGEIPDKHGDLIEGEKVLKVLDAVLDNKEFIKIRQTLIDAVPIVVEATK